MPLLTPETANALHTPHRRGWRWLFRYGLIGGLSAVSQFVAESARRNWRSLSEWYRDGEESNEVRRKKKVLLSLETLEDRIPPSEMLFSNGLMLIGGSLAYLGYEGYEPKIQTENRPGDIDRWLSADMPLRPQPLRDAYFEPKSFDRTVEAEPTSPPAYQRWDVEDGAASFLGGIGEAGSWSRWPEMEAEPPLVDSRELPGIGGGGGGDSSFDSNQAERSGSTVPQSANGEWSDVANNTSAFDNAIETTPTGTTGETSSDAASVETFVTYEMVEAVETTATETAADAATTSASSSIPNTAFIPNAPATPTATTDPTPQSDWQGQTGVDEATAWNTVENITAQQPIRFEQNAGQTDAAVDYTAHGLDYQLWLTSTEAVLALSKAQPSPEQIIRGRAATNPLEVLRFQLVGSNTTATAEGLNLQVAESNYFQGNNPDKWRTDIANYGKVIYRDVYAGIDLVYYGTDGGKRLEFDFVVKPGADPARIAFDVKGALTTALDGNGNLVLTMRDGSSVVQNAPVLYQTVNGSRQNVAGRFRLAVGGRVSFEVTGSYDRQRDLVIDPVLNYGTYLGGSDADGANGVQVDADGNIYLTGYTASSNFPVYNPIFVGSGSPVYDVFVTKIDSAGTLVFSTYLGGSSFGSGDTGYGLAIDAARNIYVTGVTDATDFPTTAGAFRTQLESGYTAFVSKINPAGNALVYSTLLSGNSGGGTSTYWTGSDFGNAIDVDDNGSAVVTGETASAYFPVGNAQQNQFGGGTTDAFVTKLNSDGSTVVFSTYHGGSGADRGNGLALDSAGNAHVVGTTSSSNLSWSASYDNSLAGVSDLFVSRFSSSGSLGAGTYFGGTGDEEGLGIAVDEGNNPYITGSTTSTDLVTVNPVQNSNAGDSDAFVVKWSSLSTTPVYSTYLGGGGSDSGRAITVDGQGRAVIVGDTNSDGTTYTPSFPLAGANQNYGGGASDAFVTRLTATGNTLSYSTFLGGSGADVGRGAAVDYEGSIFATGETDSATDFPTKNPYQSSNAGSSDAFVVKIGAGPEVSIAATTPTILEGLSAANAFTISRTAVGVSSALTVIYSVSGTASTPSDYATLTYSAVIPANAQSVAIALTTYDDLVFESEESVTVTISPTLTYSAVNPVAATVLILDNTPRINVTAYDAIALEAPIDTGIFRIARANSITPTLTVNYTLGGVATNGADYTTLTNSVVIPSGQRYVDVLVTPIYDAVAEEQEPVALTIASGTGYVVDAAGAAATVTIDERLVSIAASDPNGAEVGPNRGEFTFTRTGSTATTLTVSYAISGTAENSADYTTITSTIDIPAGSATVTLDITPIQDSATEASETIILTLQPSASYSISSGNGSGNAGSMTPSSTATGEIADATISITANDANASESGPDNGQFTITRSGDLDEALEVHYLIQGSAFNRVDYQAITASAVIGAGLSTTTVTIAPLADALDEGPETVILKLLTDPGYVVDASASLATVTIADNPTGTIVVERLTWDPLDGKPVQQVGDLQQNYGLDLDQSPGTSQSGNTQLIYNSDSVDPKPIFQVYVPKLGAVAPTSVVATLTFDGQTTVRTLTSGYSANTPLSFAIQASNAADQTDRYHWQVDVKADYATLTDENYSVDGETFLVVNQDMTAGPQHSLGAGWSLSSVDRLYSIAADIPNDAPAGMLRVYGTGSWRFYEQSGSNYISPPGDNGTLSVSGTDYLYTTPDGQVRKFDSAGMQTRWTSGDGFKALTFTYSDADSDGATDDLATLVSIDGKTATFTYSTGLLSAITAASHTYTLTYSGNDLTVVTTAGLSNTTYAYSSHLLSSATIDSYSTTYSYHASGVGTGWTQGGTLVTAVTPASLRGLLNNGAGLTYSSLTDPNADTTVLSMDSRGRPLNQVEADGAVSIWSRHATTTWVSAFVDANGNRTTYTRDSAGYVTQEQFADNSLRTYTYYAAKHNLESARDELGNRTTYTYDSDGNLRTTVNALNQTTTYTYSNGLLLSMQDANGVITSFAYDALRRQTQVIEAYSTAWQRTTTTVYDASGEALSITAPDNVVTSFVYNAAGQRTNTIEALNTLVQRRTTVVYDGAGKVLSSSDGNGVITSYVYNAAGQTTRVIEGYNSGTPRVTTTTYSGTRVDTVIGPDNVTSDYFYEPAGRQVGVVAAINTPQEYSTESGYDQVGNLLWSSDPRGVITRHTYDARNRRVKTIEAQLTGQQRTSTVVYDAAGNVYNSYAPDGTITSTAYDALNRPSRIDEAFNTGEQRSTTFLYDSVGNLLAETRGISTTSTYANATTSSFVYNVFNEAIEQYEFKASNSSKYRKTAYAFDTSGNLVRVTAGLSTDSAVPTWQATTVYDYDGLNRLTKIAEAVDDSAARTSSFGYDAADNLIVEYHGLSEGWTEDHTAISYHNYDIFGNRERSYEGVDTVDMRVRSYRYNVNDQLITEIDPLGRVRKYNYDALQQITRVTEALGVAGMQRSTNFEYDRAGNVITEIKPIGYDLDINGNLVANPAAVVNRYAYDNLNQLRIESEANATADERISLYAYDAVGNLTSETHGLKGLLAPTEYQHAVQTTYVYDRLNRKTQVVEGYVAADRRYASIKYDATDNVIETITGQSDTTTYAHATRTTFTYNYLNQRTAMSEAVDTSDRRTATYQFDAADNVVSETRGIGITPTSTYAFVTRTDYQYDALNRRVLVIEGASESGSSALRRQSAIIYDAADNVLIVSANVADQRSNASTTRYGYDVHNRVVSAIEADGESEQRQTTYLYDRADNLISQTTGLSVRTDGYAKPVTTTFAYDAHNRQTGITEAVGTSEKRRTELNYDAADNLSNRRSGLSTISAYQHESYSYFGYDKLNRLVVQNEIINATTSSERATTLQYDATDNLIRVTKAETSPINYGTYASHTYSEDVTEQTPRMHYYYDSLNRRVAVLEGEVVSGESNTGWNRLLASPLTTAIYDAADNVVGIINPLGVGTSYTFDYLNRRTVTVEAASLPTTMPSSILVPTQYWVQPVTTIAYDAADHIRTITQKEHDGIYNVTTYAYDLLDRQTGMTEAVGRAEQRRSEFIFDSANNLVSETRGIATTTLSVAGGTIAYQHITHTDYVYDHLNRRAKIVEAVDIADNVIATTLYHSRPVTTLAYDAADNLINVERNTSTASQTLISRSSYVYDALNRQTAAIDGTNVLADRRWTVKAYDAADNVIFTWDAQNAKTTYSYDGINRATRIEVDGGLVTTQTYSIHGLAVQQTPLRVTTYMYDKVGRLTRTNDAINHVINQLYDAVGNRTEVSDWVIPLIAGNPPTNPPTEHTAWRVVSTFFSYDPVNRQYGEKDPTNTKWSYTVYDGLGNIVAKYDRLDRERHFEYDGLGRVRFERWLHWDGTNWVFDSRKLGYAYDATDNLVLSYESLSATYSDDSSKDSSTWRARTYDVLNRVSTVTVPNGGTLTYTYSAADQVVKTQGLENTYTTSAYDAAGRLARRDFGIGSSNNHRVVYTYAQDPGLTDGKLDRLAHLDLYGTASTYTVLTLDQTYTNFGRVLQRKYLLTSDSTIQEQLDYTYYTSSQLVKTDYRLRVGSSRGESNWETLKTYTYDAHGQVTEIKTDGTPTPYTYDAGGNAPFANATLAEDSASGFQIKDGKHTYNAAGNLIEWQTPGQGHFLVYVFTYDHRNRLTEVLIKWRDTPTSQLFETVRVNYRYDAEDKLIERTETWLRTCEWYDEYLAVVAHTVNEQKITRYVYDGAHVWADLNSSNALVSRYVYGPGTDNLLARQDMVSSTAVTAWYLTDAQGSVLSVATATGASGKTAVYGGTSATARGLYSVAAGFHDRYEYTGRERDHITALAYYRSRWMEEPVGRFTTQDSWGFAAGDTNLYRYVGNSWPNATDPSGHVGVSDMLKEHAPSIVQDLWVFTPMGSAELAIDIAQNTYNSWQHDKVYAARNGSDTPSLLGTAVRDGKMYAGEAGTGLKVGLKANVNALGHTVQSLATVGQVDSDGRQGKAWDLWEVTPEDRANGYDASYMFARIGWEALALAGGSAGAKAVGFLGKAGRALMWADTARNVTMGAEGVNDIRKNGLTWENGLKVLGFAGARGNLSILNQAGRGGKVGRAVVAAEQFVANSKLGQAAAWTAGKVGQGAGIAVGMPFRGVDFLTKAVTGKRLFGGTAHALLDGTRFESTMKRVADWMHLKACFAAGTKLWTPDGIRNIEEIVAGQLVFARDEYDPDGAIIAKVVEETFQRTGRILHLHLVGGELIRTTSEHPFFEYNKGWADAIALMKGERVRTSSGWIAVEEVYDTGEYDTVYNLRVADFHTYFVGQEAWRFSVWAHNACLARDNEIAELARFSKGGFGFGRVSSLKPEAHHIATIYGDVGRKLGRIFRSVGVSMESAWNKTRVSGHLGPHGDIYNGYVLKQLQAAVKGHRGPARREAFLDEIYKLRRELITGDLGALVRVASKV